MVEVWTTYTPAQEKLSPEDEAKRAAFVAALKELFDRYKVPGDVGNKKKVKAIYRALNTRNAILHGDSYVSGLILYARGRNLDASLRNLAEATKVPHRQVATIYALICG